MSLDQATNILDSGMYVSGMFYAGAVIMLGMGAVYLLREVTGMQAQLIALAIAFVICATDNSLGVLGF